LSCAGIGILEDLALLVGAAILTSSVFTKAILSVGFLCLGYRECIALALWSSRAHMTGLAVGSNAITYVEVCVTWENKTIFLNRLGRPGPVEASFDSLDFTAPTGLCFTRGSVSGNFGFFELHYTASHGRQIGDVHSVCIEQ
jgi:hypothetical protein